MPAKLKILLSGSHSHRIPLAYQPYRRLCADAIEHVAVGSPADALVLGYIKDIDEPAVVDAITRGKAANPKMKVVVLSEEPLWDTTNSGDFTRPLLTRETPIGAVACHVLNHVTTKIFDFIEFPYFITTSDEYFVRYAALYERNRSVAADELLSIWRRAESSMKVAFFAEKRALKKKYGVKHPDLDIFGLSSYRSEVAEKFPGDGVLRVGAGWAPPGTEKPVRQKLPDWHLDKLAQLDRSAFMVSAIENTHLHSYITEKIFDAFAVLGLPIYFSSPSHHVRRIVPESSYLNVFGCDEDAACSRIAACKPSADLAGAYLHAQSLLSNRFRDVGAYLRERQMFSDRMVSELRSVVGH